MKILDAYIARHVAGGTLIALAVLLALTAVVAFVDELDTVGGGRYGVGTAIEFVLLTLPRHAFVLFPLAAVVGTLVGLGALAVSTELTVARAAGVSTGRIVGSALRGALVLMGIAILVGEFVAPYCERLAQTRRATAIGESSERGAGSWIRDGRRFVNVIGVRPDGRIEDMFVYEIDGEGALRSIVHAERARYRDSTWTLESVHRSEIALTGIVTQFAPTEVWDARFGPDLVNLASARLESLSILALVRYIDYLRANRVDTAAYELALWTKIVYPLATGVMILLSVPLVLGRLARAGVGQRILIGCLIAVTFHVVNGVSAKVGIVYGLDPILSAFAPTTLFLGVGVALLRQVR